MKNEEIKFSATSKGVASFCILPSAFAFFVTLLYKPIYWSYRATGGLCIGRGGGSHSLAGPWQ